MGEGISLCNSIQELQTGGRQFTCWRLPIYILEAEIVLGVLYRKGRIPKKGGTLVSRKVLQQLGESCENFSEFALANK